MTAVFLDCPICQYRNYVLVTEDPFHTCPSCNSIFQLSLTLRRSYPVILPDPEVPCREKNAKK